MQKINHQIKIGDATSARSVDANGFLTIKGCPLATFGVFEYSRAQCGDTSGNPNDIVGVYRSEQSIADPAVAASFNNKPVLNDHEFITGVTVDGPEGTAPEDKGIDGVLTGVYYDAKTKWLRGDLTIYSRSLQDDINNGKTELSLGYTSNFYPSKGSFDGKPYEYQQDGFGGNHIAVVEAARVPGAKVLDHKFSPTTPEDHMKRKAMDASSVEKLKALLPALQQFLTEEGAEPAHADPAMAGATGAAPAVVDPAAAATVPDTDPAAADPAAADPAAADPASAGGDPVAEIKAMLQQVLTLLSGTEAPADSNAGNTGPASAAQSEAEPDPEAEPKEDEGIMPVEHTMDAAVKRVYADQAAKTDLYERASKIVGAFDARTMDSKAVAVYCAKKLGIKCADGQEPVALEAYLTGAEAVAKQSVAKPTVAGDAAVQSDELAAYLSQTK